MRSGLLFVAAQRVMRRFVASRLIALALLSSLAIGPYSRATEPYAPPVRDRIQPVGARARRPSTDEHGRAPAAGLFRQASSGAQLEPSVARESQSGASLSRSGSALDARSQLRPSHSRTGSGRWHVVLDPLGSGGVLVAHDRECRGHRGALVAGEILHRDLDVSAHRLTFAQSMQQVVATDVHGETAVAAVGKFDRGHFASE